MIETVKSIKESHLAVEEDMDEKKETVEEPAIDEKAIEANVLFQHLPSFYTEEDEPKSQVTVLVKSLPVRTDEGVAAKKARLHYAAYSLDIKMNQVLPRLFISDDMIARNKSMLLKNNITHILNLTTNIPNKFEPEITYLKLVVFDFETQNISQYFSESFEFIENAFKQNENNRVLVHCNAGISRSASFVIAYLLQKRIFKRYKDAYNYVKKARPVIEPNRGFEKQLINFEKRIRKNKGCSIM